MLNEKPHKLTIDDILLLNEERLRFVKIAQRYVGKRDIAEDIYQDSIVKILNRRDEIEVYNVPQISDRLLSQEKDNNFTTKWERQHEENSPQRSRPRLP